MIVCWALFTISVVVGVIGGVGYKNYSDKMLEVRSAEMILDGVTDPAAIRSGLRELVSNLNAELQYRQNDEYEKALERLVQKVYRNRGNEAYRNLSDEQVTLHLASYRFRYADADILFQKSSQYTLVGVIAGLIAAALLLWNIFCHTVAWIIAGRKEVL